MAQRKKRPAVRKGKSIARRKARKPSKSARGRPAKRTVARATPRKRMAKARLKGGAKKGPKKVREKSCQVRPWLKLSSSMWSRSRYQALRSSPKSKRLRCVRRAQDPRSLRRVVRPRNRKNHKTVTSHAGASCRRVSLMNRRLHCRAYSTADWPVSAVFC